MRISFSMVLTLILVSGVFASASSLAVESAADKPNIFSGYYSREGNDGDMAQSSGNSHYVKFYPKNRIIRLYIPFPYSKTVTPAAINLVFSTVEKKSSGSAYIRGKFGVMEEQVVAHLDFFHWVDEQVMYDCGKSEPCRVQFDDSVMTVIKPGIVMDHKILYSHVSDK